MYYKEAQHVLTTFTRENDLQIDIQQWLNDRCKACVKDRRICYEKALIDNGYCKRHDMPKRETTFDGLLETNIEIQDT